MEAVKDRIYNPVQKDYATFLITADESDGEITLVEVELAPHGGNGLHYHTEFTEHFEVIEGELNVQNGSEHLVLKPGDTALVERGVNHRFYSTSDEPARFLVEIRPGHQGFEQALRIVYALAEEGEVSDDGRPKNPLVLASVVMMSGTKMPGLLSLMQPVFSLLARVARKRGLEQALKEAYA